MENLKIAVDNLRISIDILKEESEKFYSVGDNYRGNIRYDAAVRLDGDLKRLITARDYIEYTMKK
jgi:hypothetical protein